MKVQERLKQATGKIDKEFLGPSQVEVGKLQIKQQK